MPTKIAGTELYTIGEVAKACQVSAKTLRYYDELGLISPDYVCPENNYRFYSEQTLSVISIIRYYKQLGFKLSEMQGLIGKPSYYFHESNFIAKIDELRREEEKIREQLCQLTEWHHLIQEARIVSAEQVDTISIKYLEPTQYVALDQAFDYNYQTAILNVPWTNYLQEIDLEITGAVMLKFHDFRQKAAGKATSMTVMQKPVCTKHGVPNGVTWGGLCLSTYHLGDYRNLNSQYARMEAWAKEHGYRCQGPAYERYVVDCWTTTDSNQFVTEILMPLDQTK